MKCPPDFVINLLHGELSQDLNHADSMLKGIDIKANRQWNQARKRGPSKNTKLRLCLDILKVFFHV